MTDEEIYQAIFPPVLTWKRKLVIRAIMIGFIILAMWNNGPMP